MCLAFDSRACCSPSARHLLYPHLTVCLPSHALPCPALPYPARSCSSLHACLYLPRSTRTVALRPTSQWGIDGLWSGIQPPVTQGEFLSYMWCVPAPYEHTSCSAQPLQLAQSMLAQVRGLVLQRRRHRASSADPARRIYVRRNPAPVHSRAHVGRPYCMLRFAPTTNTSALSGSYCPILLKERSSAEARHGTARHSTARHGAARHGIARRGTARHDTA